jgi:N-acetylmuramoyl-L-alanine amidase
MTFGRSECCQINARFNPEVSFLPVRLEIRPFSSASNRASRAFKYAWTLASLAATLTTASAQAQFGPAPRSAVVLDAAPGGNDPGGSLGSEPEKTFTLAFSVRLRSLLAVRGFPVVTTRESDVALDPDRRAQIANHANAFACVSLHASQSGSGIHLYVSSLAPAEPAHLAAWKTAQSAWVSRSLAMAGVLNSALLRAGLTVTLGRTSLPPVDSMACPAVIVEISPEFAAKYQPDNATSAGLGDPAYQTRVADALIAALVQWRPEANQP